MAQLESALEFGKRREPEEYKAEAESLHKMRVHLNDFMDKIHKVHTSGYSLYDVICIFEEHPEFTGSISVDGGIVNGANADTLKEWFAACDRFRSWLGFAATFRSIRFWIGSAASIPKRNAESCRNC